MFLAKSVAQRCPLHEGHDVEKRTVHLPGVVDGQDVRVLQPGHDPDLAKEARGAKEDAELGTQDLDGNGAVMANVVSQIDVRHPAPTNLPLDDIAVGDRVLKAVEEVGGHGGRWSANPCEL